MPRTYGISSSTTDAADSGGRRTGASSVGGGTFVEDFFPEFDGYVRFMKACLTAPPGYIDWSALYWIWASVQADSWDDMGTPTPYTAIRRGYAFFDTSSIPGGATITDVTLTLSLSTLTNSTRDTIFYQQLAQYGSYGTAQALFDGLDDGVIYTQGLFTTAPPGVNVIDLGAQADADLQSHLSWFGVGVLIDETSPTATEANKTYQSMDVGVPSLFPYITVTYTT